MTTKEGGNASFAGALTGSGLARLSIRFSTCSLDLLSKPIPEIRNNKAETSY
jgi:hypothetical protein